METLRDTVGITRISIKGFKSIVREVSIDLAPLTILAGANSSGKSSIVQPLLLLKQTLGASYDPGSLLLSGPNVNFTSVSQFLSRAGREKAEQLETAISSGDHSIRLVFARAKRSGLEIASMEYSSKTESYVVRPEMTQKELRQALSQSYREWHESLSEGFGLEGRLKWAIFRERCFLIPHLTFKVRDNEQPRASLPLVPAPSPELLFGPRLNAIIHLPGLRGNPERTYPVTAVEATFPGTFQAYTASVIAQWQQDRDRDRLAMIGNDLERLGLAWRVQARQIEDTQIEIKVSRLPRRSSALLDDYVSIADVGLGLSQILPLVVALRAASPGQLVYLEQPEIHLHPRAQRVFANVLIDAVRRGVRVLVETHSSLLLLGIQTTVAEGRLNPADVALHWFQRDEKGITSVQSGRLDSAGAFGDWPEDFADVALESENKYLNAADQQLRLKVH